MELLVTIRNKEMLQKVLPQVDGVILGNAFVSSYHLSNGDIVSINEYAKDNYKKVYIVMDNFICEDEKIKLNDYFGFIESLDVDGIYFHDLGIMEVAKSFNLSSKLIYDGKSVLCNSIDAAFLLKQGIDSVMISRELTYDECLEIAKNNDGKIDMQIFGHQRMSYSKRKFLKNYFNEIKKDYDYLDKESLYLVEEKRDYKMPIVEDENGTYIYTDYILEMFKEIPEIRKHLKRGIIDTIFIDDANFICEVCRAYKRIDEKNSDFIRESLFRSYPYNYSSGYLYQKTNISKDE